MMTVNGEENEKFAVPNDLAEGLSANPWERRGTATWG